MPIEYQDCNVIADFLTTLFSRVLIAGPGGNYPAQPGGQNLTGGGNPFGGAFGGLNQQAQNRGVYFLALPQFNSILVVAPENRFGDIMREIRRIDGPYNPEVFPKPFPLKKASAQIVAQQLQQYWNTRYPGNALNKNQFRVTFDSASNIVFVQASKADLEQVERLITIFDTAESEAISDVRFFMLRNAAAADVAQIISNALSVNVVSPLTQASFSGPTAQAAGGTSGLVQTGGVGLGLPGGALGGALGGGAAGALGGALGGAAWRWWSRWWWPWGRWPWRRSGRWPRWRSRRWPRRRSGRRGRRHRAH